MSSSKRQWELDPTRAFGSFADREARKYAFLEKAITRNNKYYILEELSKL